jgi:putative tricarboxylic transport membrane protein
LTVRRLTFRQVDVIAGSIVTLVGFLVLYHSLQLAFYVEDVPGPGFFPTLLAVALSACGAALAASSARASEDDAEEFVLPSSWQARRSLGLWVAVLVASILVEIIGFLAAMFLLVALILLGIERRRGIGTIITIIATPVLAYLLFGALLRVPLPTGVFGS